jgi:hypothetical protein
MSPSVVPHAAEQTKHSVLAVPTTATVPGSECFVPSTPGAGKTRSHLSEKFIARGELKVSNLMKLRNLYGLLAIGIALLIVGLALVVIM